MDFELDPNDIFLVGDAELDEKGLVHHHITSADDLYEIGVPQIITQVFELNLRLDDIRRDSDDEKNIDHLEVHVTFSNVNINKPTLLNYNSGKEEIVFPNTCRIKEKTYKATLRIDVKVVITAIMKNGSSSVREDVVKNFKICKMPIMVGSKWCNTHGLSKETLTQLHEDPSDPGGYFIINGVEWVIDCVENILFNKVRIFRNEGYKKEKMRAEYISKPGDFYLNSDQFIVRWLTDGQLTIEIRRDKLKDLHIPFYLIFRMMGWSTDKQIFDNLLYDYDTPTAKKIKQYLNAAFNAKYAHLTNGRYLYLQNEVLQYIAEEIAEDHFAYLDVTTYSENYQRITNFLLDHMDIHFLQHMGTGIQDRDSKLRFLCVLLRKMFLVELRNMEPTDRDSYNSKRIAAAGVSCAKTIKTHFNATVIQQVRNKLTKDLRTMSFYKLDIAATIKSSVYGAEFERALTQAIKAGNKSEITVSKRTRINRLSSQLLNRKNQLSTYATLRQVTATSSDSAKQSERAKEMRCVHMSFLGYICLIHSPEGEKVGINKQLAIFAFVTKASFSEVIKGILLEDKEIFPLIEVDWEDIGKMGLCNVYVNGNWIGCCRDALYIAQKYRQKRRLFEINPEITIVWDNTQNEVYFWTDAGRVVRPLLIVYNNHRDAEFFKKNKWPQSKNFIQGLALTQEHITSLYSKNISVEDLLRAGVIEYISAEEQENMLISPSYENLCDERANELLEYTHCDIPQAVLGLTALTSPYADHNQATRIIYQTAQCKQTGGVPTKNWPYRADKDVFLQYNNETPLVKTISNKYLLPNGSNCIVALMCNTGFNQEDSLVINKGAIDRGLFNGCKFTFYKTELEQREEFANPDITTTIDIKSACYDKLVNGIIRKGAVVQKNDAIIGKIMRITKNVDDVYQYADHSVIYKDEEPAIVHEVIIDRNEDDERFAKVVLRKLRPVSVGDKFCFAPEHEVLTSKGWRLIEEIELSDQVATLNHGRVEWRNPIAKLKFDHNGPMFKAHDVAGRYMEFSVTNNHKLYCGVAGLIEAENLVEKEFSSVRYAQNNLPERKFFQIPGFAERVPAIPWLELILRLITAPWRPNNAIRAQGKIAELCRVLGFEIREDPPYLFVDQRLIEYVRPMINCYTQYIPEEFLYLGTGLSRLALHILAPKNRKYIYSRAMADALQILAFNGELSATIDVMTLGYMRRNLYVVKISSCDEAMRPSCTVEPQPVYVGPVYCLTVPNNIMLVRYRNKYAWCGNSARSGQKGTCGILLDEADMPRTAEGMAPTIIMNPHGIPSRMTIGQLIETLMGNLCAEKCAHTDATIFRKVDIESIGLELEKMGLNRYGYKKLYNGITGEYIDCEIFIGPTFYQRLQKFTADTQYSVSSGPSDAITMQPLDGKSSGGGLRIGEMERDVICSHGAMSFMSEKFFDHSDGYTRYVCRCGKAAIVNISKGIYKCNYCKDNADIVAYNTSSSSKLFVQELESMNVGIRQKPTPFIFNRIAKAKTSNE